ncbi:MAG: Gfo/Idh/MocA family oxidoreductase [Armatimonadota bacterium]|nr:Gfo/Idh/MocA family oxidoreductase [Armatimonadota bacterium]
MANNFDAPEGGKGTPTRREFLKTAGASAAGALLAGAMPAAAEVADETHLQKANAKHIIGANLKPMAPMATGRVIGANDRIQIAHIGVGGQGGTHVRLIGDHRTDNNTRSIGVSDCWEARRLSNRDEIVKRDPDVKVQVETDYRRLLDNKDVDAVVIATPEHWHAQITIDAMQAGKHVYCEKPMTRYLNEGFAVYDMQKRTGRVLQIGSQGCSDAKWRTAGEAIKAGRIGELVSAQGSYTRNSKEGEWNWPIDTTANPTNLDWKWWLGTAPDRPWNDDSRERFFRFRKFTDYSAGLLTDLLPHKVHPLMLALGLDTPEFPVRVVAVGTRHISTDRQVPDTIHVTTEFPSGYTMYFLLSTVNEQGVEDVIRGHKATMYLGGGHVHIKPERPWSEEIDEADVPVSGPGEDIAVHEADWLNCIRTGKKPNCNVDLAIRAQAVISMAEISNRESKAVRFDADKRKIIV